MVNRTVDSDYWPFATTGSCDNSPEQECINADPEYADKSIIFPYLYDDDPFKLDGGPLNCESVPNTYFVSKYSGCRYFLQTVRGLQGGAFYTPQNKVKRCPYVRYKPEGDEPYQPGQEIGSET